MGDSRARDDARAGGDLRERSAHPRHGPQGLRAGGERRDPARNRRRFLCHARRALGLRLSDRRRGGVRRRQGRRRLGGRRRVRHFLRRALPAHRPHARRHHGGASAARRRALSSHPGWPRQHGRDSSQRGRDRCHAERRRQVGGRARLGHLRRPRAHRGARSDAAREARLRVGAREASPARRNGHARQRQPLPRSAGGRPRSSIRRSPQCSACTRATSS